MATIIFDTDSTNPSKSIQKPPAGLVGFLLRTFPGILKTKQQANIVLLLLACLCTVVVVILITTSGTEVTRNGAGPSSAELEAYQRIQPH